MVEVVKSSNVDLNKKYFKMDFLKTAHHSLLLLQTAESVLLQLATKDKEFCLWVFVKTANHTLVLSTTKDLVLLVFQPKEKSLEKMVSARNVQILQEQCGKIRSVVQFHVMQDNCFKLMEDVSIATHTLEPVLMERLASHMNAKTQRDWMKMVVALLALFILEPREMEPNVVQILAV